MNANIKRTKIFHNYMWSHNGDVEFFFLILRLYDLMTTLTFILIYNFCPCFTAIIKTENRGKYYDSLDKHLFNCHFIDFLARFIQFLSTPLLFFFNS